jgi:hypothetical protein
MEWKRRRIRPRAPRQAPDRLPRRLRQHDVRSDGAYRRPPEMRRSCQLKQVGRGEEPDDPCSVRDAFCSCDNSESSKTKREYRRRSKCSAIWCSRMRPSSSSARYRPVTPRSDRKWIATAPLTVSLRGRRRHVGRVDVCSIPCELAWRQGDVALFPPEICSKRNRSLNLYIAL